MTNLRGESTNTDSNSKGKVRSASNSNTSHVWPQLEVLNQMMGPPVQQILNDADLQQELDFYANHHFNENVNPTVATADNYFNGNNKPTSSSSSVTPQMNIPADSHDFPLSHFASSSSSSQQGLSLLFNQQQPPSSSSSSSLANSNGSLLLTHESTNYSRNTLYSNHTTPANSAPSSPSINFDNNMHHFDYFATLQQPAVETTAAKQTKSKGKKAVQKFRFKQDKQPLNSLLLSKHNLKHSEQQVSTSSSTKRSKKTKSNNKDDVHEGDEDDEEEEEEDNDNYEEEPVIGDGAQSYSSMGSNSSRTSQPLSKDDKRRRNTAASARFRIKKKMREQALQSTASEMTEKAQRMEQRVHELEREIKWLKALVVEKNEARLDQLILEKPAKSMAFPNTIIRNKHNTNQDYSNNNDDEGYHY